MDNHIIKPNIDFKQEADMYKSMYLKLFNSVTDALKLLDENDNIFKASHILKQAQLDCEEIYIAM